MCPKCHICWRLCAICGRRNYERNFTYVEMKTTSEMDMFQTLGDIMMDNGSSWTNCIGICTDGGATMTGNHKGVVTRMLKVAPVALKLFFFFHRKMLAAKNLEPGLHKAVNTAIGIAMFVKVRATNSVLFPALCEEVGADYIPLLMYTEVSWLPPRRMLTRLFSLMEEL